jgi:hypothetical protein
MRVRASTAGATRLKMTPKMSRLLPAGTRKKQERNMSTKDAMKSAASPGRIADATVISRSPSVLAAEVGDEIVMMSIEQGHYFGLDDIGSDIWKRIEPPCSFGALIDGLAADYEADRATIATDVQNLLGLMAEQDVVRLA